MLIFDSKPLTFMRMNIFSSVPTKCALRVKIAPMRNSIRKHVD